MKKIKNILKLFILVAIFFTSSQTVFADTITVNSLADDGPGNCDTTCTFRDAIATATTSDEIIFEDGLTGIITLATSTPMTIDSSLTITGPGSDNLTIDFDGISNSNRIIRFEPSVVSTLSISGLKILNGSTPFYFYECRFNC